MKGWNLPNIEGGVGRHTTAGIVNVCVIRAFRNSEAYDVSRSWRAVTRVWPFDAHDCRCTVTQHPAWKISNRQQMCQKILYFGKYSDPGEFKLRRNRKRNTFQVNNLRLLGYQDFVGICCVRLQDKNLVSWRWRKHFLSKRRYTAGCRTFTAVRCRLYYFCLQGKSKMRMAL